MHLLAVVLATAASTSPPPPPATHVDRAPRPAPYRSPRPLRVTGYAALGLGSVLLGVMAGGIVTHTSRLRWLGAKEAALAPGERLGRFASDHAQRELRQARLDRDIAIGTGVAAAASFALGATLLALARGRDRTRGRLAVAPLWLSSGTGLQLQLRLR